MLGRVALGPLASRRADHGLTSGRGVRWTSTSTTSSASSRTASSACWPTRYGDLAQRQGYQKEPKGYSQRLWQQYAELGLLAVPFAEQHGGLGQGLTETMLIAEAFGRALAIEPYLATVVLAGGALRHAGNEALLRASWCRPSPRAG